MTFIGTAAWSIPKASAERFPAEGSSLARYAAVFDGVEINSSFYRRHKRDTWQRWADSVPDHFRFAVKAPQRLTHELRLVDPEPIVDEFMRDTEPLGAKLGPVLLQLPPNLSFDEKTVVTLFDYVRSIFEGCVVIEPRHQSWAATEVSALLERYRIYRVTADPPVISWEESKDPAFLYLRLHGAPKIYYSEYGMEEIKSYAARLSQASPESWCIFDNTASGAALANALELRDLIQA